jgi:hypothetical protein
MFLMEKLEEEVVSMAEKPFRSREEVKKEIRVWFNISLFCECLGLLLAVIGIVADALDRTLGLETMSWFLLAIFLSVSAAAPLVKSVAAKSLYGIESESKK